MANVGLAYWLQGRLSAASAVLEEGLRDREEDYGFMDTHSFRTADVCHKVAQHCLRNSHNEQSERLVDQALSVWSVDKSAYLPEIARTTFLKAKVAMALDRETEAIGLYRKAASMRKVLTSQAKKHDQLSEADFDELVTFWSR
ncbi:hypothetical protein PG995_008706 [Apiospora arundinis]